MKSWEFGSARGHGNSCGNDPAGAPPGPQRDRRARGIRRGPPDAPQKSFEQAVGVVLAVPRDLIPTKTQKLYTHSRHTSQLCGLPVTRQLQSGQETDRARQVHVGKQPAALPEARRPRITHENGHAPRARVNVHERCGQHR